MKRQSQSMQGELQQWPTIFDSWSDAKENWCIKVVFATRMLKLQASQNGQRSTFFLLCLEGESGTPRNWESQHVFRFHFRFNTAMTGMAAIDCLFKSVCPLAPCKYRSKEGRRRSPPGQMINLPDLKHCPEWDQKCGATWSNWMWWQCGIIQLQLLACTKAQRLTVSHKSLQPST